MGLDQKRKRKFLLKGSSQMPTYMVAEAMKQTLNQKDPRP